MKTNIEYTLLSIRQDLKDHLDYILSSDVIDLDLYRRAYAEFCLCNKMLYKCRLKSKTA
jgi:hypothetical protein